MQRDLARLIDPNAVLAGANLVETCVRERADLLVTARLGTFDLTPIAVPASFDPARIDHVVAAVGTGPHSVLAASVGYLVAQALSCHVEFVTAVRADELPRAEHVLQQLLTDRPNSSWRIVESGDPTSLLASTPEGTLIVAGAPGGNWFQRQLFGPGARLRVRAPAGSVVVRSAPRRVFHVVSEPQFWVGPRLLVKDAAELILVPVAPVVDEGVLVGVIRRSATASATAGAMTVEDVMETAPIVTTTDARDALDEVAEFFEGAPVPIVDGSGRFVGSVDQPPRLHGEK
ncbi:MAG: hypothetical protein KJO36_10440 [Acidimicrobiia bacterium]|nr:hypothetical protein [Acidimicrobiia bacterium]